MEAPVKQILVAVGIVIEEGRLLIACRPNSVPLGGLWEFPGGKVEPGETPEATAVREIQEELGIKVSPIGQMPTAEHAYPHGYVTLTPILCRRISGTPQPIHCTEFRWVLPAQLASYSFPAGNASLLHDLATIPLQMLIPPARLYPPYAGD